MGIGENIRKIRKEKGVTIKELANYLGISEQAISQYEREVRIPKTKTIYKIAELFQEPAYRIDYELFDFFELNENTSTNIEELDQINAFNSLIKHNNFDTRFYFVAGGSREELIDEIEMQKRGEIPYMYVSSDEGEIELNRDEFYELLETTCKFLRFQLLELFDKKNK